MVNLLELKKTKYEYIFIKFLGWGDIFETITLKFNLKTVRPDKVNKFRLPAHLPLIILDNSKGFSFMLRLQFNFDLTKEAVHVDQDNDPVIRTRHFARIFIRLISIRLLKSKYSAYTVHVQLYDLCLNQRKT